MNINIPNIKPIEPIKIPNIEIDTKPFKKIHENVDKILTDADKILAINNLSTFKILTCLGAKLPEKDIPEVTALVKKMFSNNWLSEEDKAWCLANEIDFN